MISKVTHWVLILCDKCPVNCKAQHVEMRNAVNDKWIGDSENSFSG